MSRFSREQLETLTKVFAEATTNHVAAAGEVTVRELAQTALDCLDRVEQQRNVITELGIDRGVYQRRAFAAEEREREIWDHLKRHQIDVCADLSKIRTRGEKTQKGGQE